MAGKLGLVGALIAVWLLGYLAMGGDVVPSGSRTAATSGASTASTTSTTSGGSAPGAASTKAGKSATTTKSKSGQGAPQAGTALARVPSADEGTVLSPRPKPRRQPDPPPVLDFVLSSFNALGSSHSKEHKGMPSGPTRIRQAADIANNYGMDVIGFQEMQANQRSAFMAKAGGTYDLYPNNALRGLDGENSIAWRKDKFDAVKLDSVAIPYFGGRPRNMPVILLKDKKTGVMAYFTNFHNPADIRKYGNQGRHRAAAKSREISLFRDLQKSGIPVFVTGDMNEKQSYFCSVAPAANMIAAAGGSTSGGCSPPPGFRIDWVLGSAGVEFSNYVNDKSNLVRHTTDHPVIVTHVRIDGKKFPKSVAKPQS